MSTTRRVSPADLKDGDRILEQGEVVTVYGDARRADSGLILVDLEAPHNTYRYDPLEIVAKIEG